MLNSDLCDYSDTYTAVKGTIVVKTENGRVIDGWNRNLTLKNNAPFTNSISKINNFLIDSAEGLNVVMLIYIIFYVGWIQPKIIKNQPVVYGITQKIFQFIL